MIALPSSSPVAASTKMPEQIETSRAPRAPRICMVDITFIIMYINGVSNHYSGH
jgi:hypothetical protein